MDRIEINMQQVRKVAESISSIDISDEHANRPFIVFESTEDLKTRAYLFCSAICHQTHNLRNESKNLIGWNYLEYVFEHLAMSNSPLLDIDYICESASDKLEEEYAQEFPVSDSNVQSSLDRMSERVELIKDIAQHIKNSGLKSVLDLFNQSEGKLIDNNGGLYSQLSKMRAFKDPLRKKSTLFIKLMNQSGLIHIQDPENIEALMDYHMQRLLLRTGCVEVLDPSLMMQLKSREHILSDEEIRKTCVQAIKQIGTQSEKSVLDLDDIFWAIGRSCCNDKILCVDKRCSKTPCTLTVVSNIKDHGICVFDSACKGHHYIEYRKYWEPMVSTDFY